MKNSLSVFAATALASMFALTFNSCKDPDPVANPDLIVTPLSLTFDAEGDTKTVTVTGEGWTAAPDAAWIVVENTTDGTGFTVTVGATTEERTGTIVVSNADRSHTVGVAQNAPTVDPAILVLDPDELTFAVEGGERTVTVTSDLTWTATTTDGWLTVTKLDDTRLKVEAALNTTAGELAREGSVTVSNGENEETITISQASPEPVDPSIAIDPESLAFTFEGGEQTVAVTSALDWTVSTIDAWITATKNGDTFTVSVTANTGAAGREGSVTVDNGTQTATIAVEQGIDMGTRMIRAKGTHMTYSRSGKTYDYFELHFTTYEGSTLTMEPNDPSDNGYHLFMVAYTDVPTGTTQWNIDEGTYTYATTRAPLTLFDNGYYDACWLQEITNGQWSGDKAVGATTTMTVSGNGTDGYLILFDIDHGDGTRMKAYYEGEISIPR